MNNQPAGEIRIQMFSVFELFLFEYSYSITHAALHLICFCSIQRILLYDVVYISLSGSNIVCCES